MKESLPDQQDYFPGLDPRTRKVRLKDPQYDGSREGRVLGVDLVQYDAADVEIARAYMSFRSMPFHPGLGVLQDRVNRVNEQLAVNRPDRRDPP